AHFAAGRYREAAAAYEAAHALHPVPAFLFNIAQCYRNLRDYSKAVTYYKAYLLDAPAAPNRRSIVETIHQLEQEIRKQKEAEAAAPAPAPPVPAPAPPPSPTPPPAAASPAAVPPAAAPPATGPPAATATPPPPASVLPSPSQAAAAS